MYRKSILLALLLGAGMAHAEEAAQGNLEDVPEPPQIPAQVESGEALELEPQVTIIRKKDATIEEYRINGRLYMAKITPVVGPSYYLVDRDGDGQFESRINDIYEDIPVPQWVLLTW
ncbi:MAG: DUF2782 domain-containing protein [Gammaproteobacteria bacterium]